MKKHLRTAVHTVLGLAFLANMANMLVLVVGGDHTLNGADFDGFWTRICACLVMVAALLYHAVDRGSPQDEKDLLYLFAMSCLNFLMPFAALAFSRGLWILSLPAIACAVVALILFVRSRKPHPPRTETTTWTA